MWYVQSSESQCSDKLTRCIHHLTAIDCMGVCIVTRALLFLLFQFTFGIMTVGAPACGMNSCIRAFVRMSLFAGHRVKAIYDGFSGLVEGKVSRTVYLTTRCLCRLCDCSVSLTHFVSSVAG